MPYLALVLIALGGWFKAAAAYQLHGTLGLTKLAYACVSFAITPIWSS